MERSSFISNIWLCIHNRNISILYTKINGKCYKVQFKTSDHPDHLIILQHGFWGMFLLQNIYIICSFVIFAINQRYIDKSLEYLAPWIQSYPLGKYMAKIATQKTTSDSNNPGYLIKLSHQFK